MTKEIQIMNEVLEALNGNKLSSEQMDKLLLIMTQQLSERAPNKRIKAKLDNQVKQLLKEVKHKETIKFNEAFNQLRENFNNGKKISIDTIKNIDIVKDNIDYTKNEKEFIAWLEDIMTIKKGRTYKIKSIDEPKQVKQEKDRTFELRDINVFNTLLLALTSKNIINGYQSLQMKEQLESGKDVSTIIRIFVESTRLQEVLEIIQTLNNRVLEHEAAQKRLY